MFTLKNFLKVFFSLVIMIPFTACKSTPQATNQEENVEYTSMQELEQLKDQIKTLINDENESKKLLMSIQMDLQSQREILATEKKNIAILRRGLRSGMFEELPEDKHNIELKDTSKTMLPNLLNSHTGFTENKDTAIDTKPSAIIDKDSPVGPKELLTSAQLKIQRDQLKEGLKDLDELKKNYPNFDDNGRSFLLAAEAWLKLKQYNNVIPEIQNFYLKYPSNAELAHAKLLEAQATEGNGLFEKAANLYAEVLSLSPRSSYAQAARDGMLRMRDEN